MCFLSLPQLESKSNPDGQGAAMSAKTSGKSISVSPSFHSNYSVSRV